MNKMKLACLATTALVGNMFVAAGAHAQSTGTSSFETIVVTGSTGPATVGGMIQEETVAKTRTTIDQEFIDTQVPGQTILQTLNIVTPGLNFTNNDPYGTSGGNIRLHGFDGNRVALTFDGMPLNDTGNYATFTNQLVDNELISKAQVNTGSTDADSPTAASTGGTIGLTSRTPSDTFGGWGQVSIGDFNYHRYMALVDTGEIGPWGTKAWAALSFQEYDKFKGKGDLEKWQFNTKLYQPIGENGDFVSVALHYNKNRNNAYFGPNLETYNADGSIRTAAQVNTDPRGYEFDFNPTYAPIVTTTRAGFAGDIDVDPAANSNYYGLRINPSDTANIRGQSKFSFGDRVTLTVDPSFQYTLANGGTQNILLWESCNGSGGGTLNTVASCPVLTRQLLGNLTPTTALGVDLNGDGDINDQVRLMNPSNTNTRRIGLLSSLIWEVTDDQLFRLSYAYDRGRHRQTGEFGYVNSDNTYASYFGGKEGQGRTVNTRDGNSFLRNRDRYSIALLNQISGEYRGSFFDDALSINIGLRAPFFERQLNQYCYSQNGTTFVRCTTETPNATLANGNVTFAGATTQYVEPFSTKLKFDDVLPNVGANWFFGDSQIFGSYAESTSLPRTDNLYQPIRLATATTVQSIALSNVEPETSSTLEGGYRYSKGNLIASASAWRTDFKNRIVNSFDQDLGISVDRNVGKVEQWGVDFSAAWSPFEEISLYASASYNDSEVQDDVRLNGTANGTLPTKGKQLVETPDWTWSTRVEYRPTAYLTFGGQIKYVGERWATDVNDLKVDSYAVTDIDARLDLEDLIGRKDTSIRVNVINLFDEDYYGSIGSVSSVTTGYASVGTAFASPGAPRTFTVTLRAGF